MPEGDTIYGAARRIRAALIGKEIAAIETPHPRHARDRWPEGRDVRAVESRGKHLLIRHVRDPWVFDRSGRPCRRCGTKIRARGQGDDNRTTYWCPACQA